MSRPLRLLSKGRLDSTGNCDCRYSQRTSASSSFRGITRSRCPLPMTRIDLVSNRRDGAYLLVC